MSGRYVDRHSYGDSERERTSVRYVDPSRYSYDDSDRDRSSGRDWDQYTHADSGRSLEIYSGRHDYSRSQSDKWYPRVESRELVPVPSRSVAHTSSNASHPRRHRPQHRSPRRIALYQRSLRRTDSIKDLSSAYDREWPGRGSKNSAVVHWALRIGSNYYEAVNKNGELRFRSEPSSWKPHNFVKFVGETMMSHSEIEDAAYDIEDENPSYSLLRNNCQHFVNKLAMAISVDHTGIPVPTKIATDKAADTAIGAAGMAVAWSLAWSAFKTIAKASADS